MSHDHMISQVDLIPSNCCLWENIFLKSLPQLTDSGISIFYVTVNTNLMAAIANKLNLNFIDFGHSSVTAEYLVKTFIHNIFFFLQLLSEYHFSNVSKYFHSPQMVGQTCITSTQYSSNKIPKNNVYLLNMEESNLFLRF